MTPVWARNAATRRSSSGSRARDGATGICSARYSRTPAGGRACASARTRARCRRGRPRERAAARSDRASPLVQLAGIGRDRRGVRRRPLARGSVGGRTSIVAIRSGTRRSKSTASARGVPPPDLAVVEVMDELAEERADRDRRGRRPVDRAATRFDIDRAEDGGARRPRLVHGAGGDPERPRGRQDVAAAALGGTTSTPSGDHASWWSGCECHSKRVPTGIGNVQTIAAGAGCPFIDITWQRTPFRKQTGSLASAP